MDFKKNQLINISITDLSIDGMGIGKADGFAFFVSGAAPGDYIRMQIVKLKKSYGYGIIKEIINPSPIRISPDCNSFGKCGGCSLRHISYSSQLEFKRSIVKNNLVRIGGFPDSIYVNEAIGMEYPYYYRNKGQYPVGTKNGKTVVGFYAPRSHNIIPIEKCMLASESDSAILKTITSFMDKHGIAPYNEADQTGILRHILIKTSHKTSDIMVCLVINSTEFPFIEDLTPLLKRVGVTTIVLNINQKNTNVILGSKTKIVFGSGYITDYIKDLKFKISPLSFFQVNPVQTEKLYDTILSLADLKGNEIVFDAYCGIGTISLFLARKAKSVYGIEIVPQAISDAKENAKNNHITNAFFYTGPSETICPDLCRKNILPDVIVVDPPRKGCAPPLLETILRISPEKLIYTSCNPSTLARDLKYISPTYVPTQIVPVDMFPHSTNVETVVLLKRK